MTKTSLCPAVDDQGRKCRKLQPHFDYEHIFMDDPSKGPIPPALSPRPSDEWFAKARALMREIAANPPRTEEAVTEKVKEVRSMFGLPPSDEKPPA